jgi:hypothetical protein
MTWDRVHMAAIAMIARVALACAAAGFAWYLSWAAQFMLGFARDEVLAACLAILVVAGLAGVGGMTLRRWWGPALIGLEAVGFLVVVRVFGDTRFLETLVALGLVAMVLVSIALLAWESRAISRPA